jgi:hypothetical protein
MEEEGREGGRGDIKNRDKASFDAAAAAFYPGNSLRRDLNGTGAAAIAAAAAQQSLVKSGGRMSHVRSLPVRPSKGLCTSSKVHSP